MYSIRQKRSTWAKRYQILQDCHMIRFLLSYCLDVISKICYLQTFFLEDHVLFDPGGIN